MVFNNGCTRLSSISILVIQCFIYSCRISTALITSVLTSTSPIYSISSISFIQKSGQYNAQNDVQNNVHNNIQNNGRRHLLVRHTFRLNMDAVEIGREGYTSANLENPPFFPSTVEELAYDVAFTTKIALINRIKRIRVDVRMRLTSRDRYMLKWLLLTSINLLDDSDEDSNVHLFIDKTCDLIRCQELWTEILNNKTEELANRGINSGTNNGVNGVNRGTEFNVHGQQTPHTHPQDTQQKRSTSRTSQTEQTQQTQTEQTDEELRIQLEIKETQQYLKKLSKVHISPISDVHLRESDSILVIFNPDNMHSCEHPDLLEDVQALCFHAALRKIPVVLINPQLMATAWNDYGARTPLLLSDFAQAYFICDDYFMFSRRDQWCGIIQRAASGMPYDIKSYLRQLLTKDPNFPLREIFEKEDLVNRGIRDVCYGADGTAYNNGDFKGNFNTRNGGNNGYNDGGGENGEGGEGDNENGDGENGLSIEGINKGKKRKVVDKSGWRNIVPAPARRASTRKTTEIKTNEGLFS